MKRFDLTVEARQAGRNFSRGSRLQSKIPAVIYGSAANYNVTLDENTLVKFNTRAYENALFNIKSAEAKLNGVVVLMKEVQVHPVGQ